MKKMLCACFERAAGGERHLLSIEGLRGAAVLLVFLVHYTTLVRPYIQGDTLVFADSLHTIGNAGVDLFFALSGYLIYGTLIARSQPFGRFIGRRMQRLYPSFLVVLTIHVALLAVYPEEAKLPNGMLGALSHILANLLLLPGLVDIPPIITVSWLLSYEMAFYVTLPGVISALRLRNWSPANRIAMLLLTVLAAQALHLPHPRLGMFACGMLLAELAPILRARGRITILLDSLACAAIPACSFVMVQGHPAPVSFAALFATCFLLCASCLAHHGPLARAMELNPLRWLGNMSYSYYLVHGLMLKAFFLAFSGATALHHLGNALMWFLLPPAFAVTLAGAAVLFLAVERPFSILPAERVLKAPAARVATIPAES